MSTSKQLNVAIVGATGLVGRQMLTILAQRKFPVGSVSAFASERSVGSRVPFNGEQQLSIIVGRTCIALQHLGHKPSVHGYAANATADYANPAQMNHFTWYQTHGWNQPYPGENKIYAPNDVPGAYLPSSVSDD